MERNNNDALILSHLVNLPYFTPISSSFFCIPDLTFKKSFGMCKSLKEFSVEIFQSYSAIYKRFEKVSERISRDVGELRYGNIDAVIESVYRNNHIFFEDEGFFFSSR